MGLKRKQFTSESGHNDDICTRRKCKFAIVEVETSQELFQAVAAVPEAVFCVEFVKFELMDMEWWHTFVEGWNGVLMLKRVVEMWSDVWQTLVVIIA